MIIEPQLSSSGNFDSPKGFCMKCRLVIGFVLILFIGLVPSIAISVSSTDSNVAAINAWVGIIQVAFAGIVSVVIALAAVRYHMANLEIHVPKSYMIEQFADRNEITRISDALADKIELSVLKALQKYYPGKLSLTDQSSDG